jgi:hypothetical protein
VKYVLYYYYYYYYYYYINQKITALKFRRQCPLVLLIKVRVGYIQGTALRSKEAIVIKIRLLKCLAEEWAEFCVFESGIVTKFCDEQPRNILEGGVGIIAVHCKNRAQNINTARGKNEGIFFFNIIPLRTKAETGSCDLREMY